MARNLGLVVSRHATLGVVDGDRVVGDVARYPSSDDLVDELRGIPTDELVGALADELKALAEGEAVEVVGLAFPGIIRSGVIEESPNLQQLKGFPMESAMQAALAHRGIQAKVTLSNDADVVASGIAAMHGKLDKLVRVWTLGDGIGFGR